MIIPNIWENKKWQPNHQPELNPEFSCGISFWFSYFAAGHSHERLSTDRPRLHCVHCVRCSAVPRTCQNLEIYQGLGLMSQCFTSPYYSHDGSMYGKQMLTKLGYIDGQCYHIYIAYMDPMGLGIFHLPHICLWIGDVTPIHKSWDMKIPLFTIDKRWNLAVFCMHECEFLGEKTWRVRYDLRRPPHGSKLQSIR